MTTDKEFKQEESPPVSAPGATAARHRREITSAELFGEAREIKIRHSDDVYTLRRTNKGKLILTK